MKTFSLICVLLAGVSMHAPLSAQQAGGELRMRTRVVAKDVRNGRPTDIFIVSSNGPNFTYTESATSQEYLQMRQSACHTLYMLETPDFVAALHDFENRKYREARTKFHNLATKYNATLSVKNSLAARASVYELQCSLALMDWAAAKDLAAKFPVNKRNLSTEAQNDLELAGIMGLIADRNWAELKIKANAFLTTHKNATNMQKAYLKYALAAVDMTEKHWDAALDNFAEAIVLLHGADETLLTACVTRSLDCYLNMDSVQNFFKTPAVESTIKLRDTNGQAVLNENSMKNRPLAVREGANLYHLYTIMAPGKPLPAKYNGFAASFLHPNAPQPDKKGAQKDAAPATE